MEDGVNGVLTRLAHEHVEVEYSGEQGLVQIHGISEKNYNSRLRLFFNHVIHRDSASLYLLPKKINYHRQVPAIGK